MPTYIFHNTETDEYWEELMKISEMESFLEEYPAVKVVPQAPMIVTGVNVRGGKVDAGWQETMSKVAEANPYSPHAERYGSTDSKSVKRRELVDKHIKRKKKLKW